MDFVACEGSIGERPSEVMKFDSDGYEPEWQESIYHELQQNGQGRQDKVMFQVGMRNDCSKCMICTLVSVEY